MLLPLDWRSTCQTLIGRNQEKLSDVAERCRALGAFVQTYCADFRDAVEVDVTARAISSDNPLGFDLVVHGAGVFYWCHALEAGPELWAEVLMVNLQSVMVLNHALLPDMCARGHGTVVHIGSVAGQRVFLEGTGYCASKFGLQGYSGSLFEDVRKQGVKVCCLNPGQVANSCEKEAGGKIGEEGLDVQDIVKSVEYILDVSPASCPTEICLRSQYGDLP